MHYLGGMSEAVTFFFKIVVNRIEMVVNVLLGLVQHISSNASHTEDTIPSHLFSTHDYI